MCPGRMAKRRKWLVVRYTSRGGYADPHPFRNLWVSSPKLRPIEVSIEIRAGVKAEVGTKVFKIGVLTVESIKKGSCIKQDGLGLGIKPYSNARAAVSFLKKLTEKVS